MSPSFLVKIFELHIEAFHSFKSISTVRAGRCLIPKSEPARTNAKNALIEVKHLYV